MDTSDLSVFTLVVGLGSAAVKDLGDSENPVIEFSKIV